jgi:hypothetical protein
MPPCGRADFGPEISCGATAPRASYAPLDRLPGSFRAGRSGWPKTQFGSTMGYGLVLYDRNPERSAAEAGPGPARALL